MSHLLLNIFLAVVWAAIVGEFTVKTLAFGFVLGYLVILLASPVMGRSGYVSKVWRSIALLAFFFKELFVSSLIVARDVLRPRFHMHSGIIGIPLDAASDVEITMLANMISLTPGTLSLDVSDDRKTLYIHAMYLDKDDIPASAAGIKAGLERRLLKVLREEDGLTSDA